MDAKNGERNVVTNYFRVEVSLMNAVVNTLAQRPYAEVGELINRIQAEVSLMDDDETRGNG